MTIELTMEFNASLSSPLAHRLYQSSLSTTDTFLTVSDLCTYFFARDPPQALLQFKFRHPLSPLSLPASLLMRGRVYRRPEFLPALSSPRCDPRYSQCSFTYARKKDIYTQMCSKSPLFSIIKNTRYISFLLRRGVRIVG